MSKIITLNIPKDEYDQFYETLQTPSSNASDAILASLFVHFDPEITLHVVATGDENAYPTLAFTSKTYANTDRKMSQPTQGTILGEYVYEYTSATGKHCKQLFHVTVNDEPIIPEFSAAMLRAIADKIVYLFITQEETYENVSAFKHLFGMLDVVNATHMELEYTALIIAESAARIASTSTHIPNFEAHMFENGTPLQTAFLESIETFNINPKPDVKALWLDILKYAEHDLHNRTLTQYSFEDM